MPLHAKADVAGSSASRRSQPSMAATSWSPDCVNVARRQLRHAAAQFETKTARSPPHNARSQLPRSSPRATARQHACASSALRKANPARRRASDRAQSAASPRSSEPWRAASGHRVRSTRALANLGDSRADARAPARRAVGHFVPACAVSSAATEKPAARPSHHQDGVRLNPAVSPLRGDTKTDSMSPGDSGLRIPGKINSRGVPSTSSESPGLRTRYLADVLTENVRLSGMTTPYKTAGRGWLSPGSPCQPAPRVTAPPGVGPWSARDLASRLELLPFPTVRVGER